MMAVTALKKMGPAIDAKLHEEFVAVARQYGHSQRYLLEKAIDHYIHNVVPSQHTVPPDVMAAYRRSNEKFKELYRKLAE
jgi:hypothetical protein